MGILGAVAFVFPGLDLAFFFSLSLLFVSHSATTTQEWIETSLYTCKK